jgi:hypothetical protein
VAELRAEKEREIVMDEDREIQRKRVEEYRANQKTCQVMLNREKHKTETLTNDVDIAREELIASQANEAELKRNLKRQAKALAGAKAAAAAAIAAMATPNATSSGSQELAKLVAQRDQLLELNAQHQSEHEQSKLELYSIIKTKRKKLKQERTAKDNMETLYILEQRKVKNHLNHGKYLANTIQAKRETARVNTKEERAKWRAHRTRVAKETELELKHEKKVLHKTYSMQAQRERSSAAAKLLSKDEQITAMMTQQEREKKLHQEELDAAGKDAEASIRVGLGTKDQQIAELKKAAAENDVECIICMDEFHKSDTNQWRMMSPCCHVFCSKCVESHENDKMPECKQCAAGPCPAHPAALDECPNCHKACKMFLQANFEGFVSDDAVAVGGSTRGRAGGGAGGVTGNVGGD